MTPERWRQIEDLYHAALECAPRDHARIVVPYEDFVSSTQCVLFVREKREMINGLGTAQTGVVPGGAHLRIIVSLMIFS